MIHSLIQRLVVESNKMSGFVKIYQDTVADDRQIAQWENKYGFILPDDYKLYLKEVGRCKLHGSLPATDHSFSVKLFSINEIAPFTALAFGKSRMANIPESWYAIADAQDGNYIIMDMPLVHGTMTRIIDGFSESAPDLAIIALSFSEFLECSLADPNTSSGGGNVQSGARYWSTEGHYYGQAM